MKEFRNKTVLLTGASGFIGSHMVECLLGAGAKVHVMEFDYGFSRVNFGWSVYEGDVVQFKRLAGFHRGDLRDNDDLMRAVVRAEPDFLFHLGAETQVTEGAQFPVHAFDVNATGTLRVLDACHRVAPGEIQIVVSTSDKVYGNVPDGVAYEYAILDPTHPYDVSKAAADQISRAYARFYGERVQVARMANVYGGGDLNWKRIIPGAIRAFANGERFMMRSDGTPERQYLFVDDAVSAMLTLALHGSNEAIDNGMAWNFGPDDVATVLQIVDAIYSMMSDVGGPAQLDYADKSKFKESQRLIIDSTKANTILKWHPAHDLKGGLSKTVSWYQHYFAFFGEDKWEQTS